MPSKSKIENVEELKQLQNVNDQLKAKVARQAQAIDSMLVQRALNTSSQVLEAETVSGGT